ncbi:MAG TPA: hypothetical protein ENG87_02775 [Candidatus Pacearchaeota archaeon]|nr:hypothetical protein [Candidatus Pacearchaeota archaeon]
MIKLYIAYPQNKHFIVIPIIEDGKILSDDVLMGKPYCSLHLKDKLNQSPNRPATIKDYAETFDYIIMDLVILNVLKSRFNYRGNETLHKLSEQIIRAIIKQESVNFDEISEKEIIRMNNGFALGLFLSGEKLRVENGSDYINVRLKPVAPDFIVFTRQNYQGKYEPIKMQCVFEVENIRDFSRFLSPEKNLMDNINYMWQDYSFVPKPYKESLNGE